MVPDFVDVSVQLGVVLSDVFTELFKLVEGMVDVIITRMITAGVTVPSWYFWSRSGRIGWSDDVLNRIWGFRRTCAMILSW